MTVKILFIFISLFFLSHYINSVSLDWGVDYDRIHNDPVHNWNMSLSLKDEDAEGFFLFKGEESEGCLKVSSVSAGIKSDFFSLGPIAWGPVYRNLFGQPFSDSREGEPYHIVKSDSFNRSGACFNYEGIQCGVIQSGNMHALSVDLLSESFSCHTLLSSAIADKTAETDWIREYPLYPGVLMHNLFMCKSGWSGPLSIRASLLTARGPGFPFQHGLSGSFSFKKGGVSFFQDILLFTSGYITPDREPVSDMNLKTEVRSDFRHWNWSAETVYDIYDDGRRLFIESLSVKNRLNSKNILAVRLIVKHENLCSSREMNISLQGKSYFMRYNLEKYLMDENYQIQSFESGFFLGNWKLEGELECRTDTRETYTFSVVLKWKGPRMTLEESVSVKNWAVPRKYGEVPSLIHSYRIDGNYNSGLYN